MNTFTLCLYDSRHSEKIADVTSFVGEDDSGSFGMLAKHARAMTCLVVGLARFRIKQQAWTYLAVSGGLLYFTDNSLIVTASHYSYHSDYSVISDLMEKQILSEEENQQAFKNSLQRMEEAVLRRLWKDVQGGNDFEASQ